MTRTGAHTVLQLYQINFNFVRIAALATVAAVQHRTCTILIEYIILDAHRLLPWHGPRSTNRVNTVTSTCPKVRGRSSRPRYGVRGTVSSLKLQKKRFLRAT